MAPELHQTPSMDALFDWARATHPGIWWLLAGSLAALIVTPIAVAAAVVRLPPNYFAPHERTPLRSLQSHPALRITLLVAKNVAGVGLLIAGCAMLLLPGQGLLTILAGLALTDFPGKFRLERWLALRPSVWRSINWVRKCAGRQPMQRPD